MPINRSLHGRSSGRGGARQGRSEKGCQMRSFATLLPAGCVTLVLAGCAALVGPDDGRVVRTGNTFAVSGYINAATTKHILGGLGRLEPGAIVLDLGSRGGLVSEAL